MSITEENFNHVKSKILASPFAEKNYIARKHQKGYWKYRFLRPFLKLRYNRFCKQNPDLPWLTPDSIEVLKTLLRPSFTALEYGSGRSTLFFSQKVEKLYSVEHHEDWFKQVQKQLQDQHITNTVLTLKTPEGSLPSAPMSSEAQAFTNEQDYPIKDSCFTAYTEYIDTFENDFFDFILVDGRARKTCTLKAMGKLKKGGVLVLDNSERTRYKEVHDTLSNWSSITTTTGLTDTTIWHKSF